jgi:hypothetical protein
MHEQIVVGVFSPPHFCETRAAMGTALTPAEPISGLICRPNFAHEFAEQPRLRCEAECDNAEKY